MGVTTYATWRPAAPAQQMTLTNGNLTIVGVDSGWRSGRSTIGVNAGKWYCELHVDFEAGASNLFCGVGTEAMALNGYVGQDVQGWGYQSLGGPTGLKYNGGAGISYGVGAGAGYATGSTIGIKLDADAKTIECLVNNVSQGVMFTGLPTSPLFIAVGIYGSASGFTANFGATPFTYPIPTGYTGGPYVASPVGATFATLDVVAANLVISNSGRTVTKTAAGGVWNSAKTSMRKSVEGWYWEATAEVLAGSYQFIGGCNPLSSLEPVGQDPNGFSWQNSGRLFTGAGYVGTQPAFVQGDVLGFGFDQSVGYKLFKNGIAVESYVPSFVGPYGATASMWYLNDVVTFNFGSVPFKYAPPFGCNPGLYTP